MKDLINEETKRFAEQEIEKEKEYLDEHYYARGNDWRRKPMAREEIDRNYNYNGSTWLSLFEVIAFVHYI